jgi:hypothetical protein
LTKGQEINGVQVRQHCSSRYEISGGSKINSGNGTVSLSQNIEDLLLVALGDLLAGKARTHVDLLTFELYSTREVLPHDATQLPSSVEVIDSIGAHLT